MNTEPTPYRLPVADSPKPVCAKCQHRADAKVQDPTEPWRDWFCLATTKQVLSEQYNPLTGETRAAVMGHERCIDMNAEGQCTQFAPLPDEQQPQPEVDRTPPFDASESHYTITLGVVVMVLVFTWLAS